MKNTKENIINAFFEIAESKPIHLIKVKHITDRINYNRCTFYQYFDDIYDLLDQVENKIIKNIIQEIERIYSPTTTYEEILIIGAESFQKYGKYLSILIGPQGSPSFQNKYIKALKPIICSIMEKNHLEYNDYIAEYALGGFLSSVSYWYHHQNSLSSKEVASLIYKLSTQGIFPNLSIFSKEKKDTSNI